MRIPWMVWRTRFDSSTWRWSRFWTSSLTTEGHPVSERTVNRLLHSLGHSLQSSRKAMEGRQHPDRHAQFRRIDRRVRAFRRLGQPVISVDTKKKGRIGPYLNGGREWRPKGNPEEVNVHDFPGKELGKAIPYGVCDLTPTKAGSAPAPATTPRRSRWKACGRGGGA